MYSQFMMHGQKNIKLLQGRSAGLPCTVYEPLSKGQVTVTASLVPLQKEAICIAPEGDEKSI